MYIKSTHCKETFTNLARRTNAKPPRRGGRGGRLRLPIGELAPGLSAVVVGKRYHETTNRANPAYLTISSRDTDQKLTIHGTHTTREVIEKFTFFISRLR
jgi:hypothetical protein